MEDQKQRVYDALNKMGIKYEVVEHEPVHTMEDMDRLVAQSAPYTLAEWNQRSWLRKMCASLLRLVAIWF